MARTAGPWTLEYPADPTAPIIIRSTVVDPGAHEGKIIGWVRRQGDDQETTDNAAALKAAYEMADTIDTLINWLNTPNDGTPATAWGTVVAPKLTGAATSAASPVAADVPPV